MLDVVDVGPDDAEAVVVWLHGLGADGHDFEPLVPLFGLPEVRFVFPHAFMRPVTINGGYVMRAWYDIRTLAEGPGRESVEDIVDTAAMLGELIRDEQSRGAKKVLLAGFSQGGAMAYHVGLRFPEPLAGILALSTYLVMEDTLEDEMSPANRTTPILSCHGTHDEVVPLARGLRAHKRVAAGRDARWHTFPVAHGLHEDEVALIRAWLHERLR